MGSGSKSTTATLPPPPTPTPQYDVATTAAENALASQAKQSYASTTADADKKKSNLGDAPQSSKAPASVMAPAGGGISNSAVLTG